MEILLKNSLEKIRIKKLFRNNKKKKTKKVQNLSLMKKDYKRF